MAVIQVQKIKFLVPFIILLSFQTKRCTAFDWDEILAEIQKTYLFVKNLIIKLLFTKEASISSSSRPILSNDLEILKNTNCSGESLTKYIDDAILLATGHKKVIMTHKVTTEDGYILTLHQLLSPNGTELMNQTVLLHHGLTGDSSEWMILGPERALSYKLSNKGYDVWMINVRGRKYSKSHAWISPNKTNSKYWNFTWQEMGKYDLPAALNYIDKVKKNKGKMNFIGYSMGATAFLVLLSEFSFYNDHFRMAILVAPLAFMTNIKGTLLRISEEAMSPTKKLYNMLGREEYSPIVKDLNINIDLSDYESSYSGLSHYISKTPIPFGMSTNTILHYAQLVKTGKFHEFKNESAAFKLAKVRLPIAMIVSDKDHMATLENVNKLFVRFEMAKHRMILQVKGLDHLDFVKGVNVHRTVYPKIMNILTTFDTMDDNSVKGES